MDSRAEKVTGGDTADTLNGYIKALRCFFGPAEKRSYQNFDAFFFRRYSFAAISFTADSAIETSTDSTPPGAAKYDLGGKWSVVFHEKPGAGMGEKAPGSAWGSD